MALSKREGEPTRHFNAAAPRQEPPRTRRTKKGKGGGMAWAVQAAERTAAYYASPKGRRP